MALPDLMNMIT